MSLKDLGNFINIGKTINTFESLGGFKEKNLDLYNKFSESLSKCKTESEVLELTARLKLNPTLTQEAIELSSVKTATDLTAVSQTAATGSTSSLGLAFQGLAAKIGISTAALGAFMGVAAGIGVGIAVFKMYQQHIENVRKATQEAADTYKDASSSVDDYTSRYAELKQALEDARGNEEETYNVKKQLLDLQTELNDKFG